MTAQPDKPEPTSNKAGHMMYVHIPSLKAQAKHLREFLKTAS